MAEQFRRVRAVLDINNLISAGIAEHGAPFAIVAAWRQRRFDHVTSEHIITRLIAKLHSEQLRRRFDRRELERYARDIEAALRAQARVVEVPEAEVATVTGDPEDDTVLATARLARADYLVTGDKGLLGLGEHAGCQIVNSRQFLAILEQQQAGSDSDEPTDSDHA